MTKMKNMNRSGILSRLLAKENISVIRGNTNTASFDVKNRVLRFPYWDDASNDVADLFIGHEVSHALHTPYDKITMHSNKYPFSYLNIVEDIRIERLILTQYPGLTGNFKRGYKELVDRDIFSLEDKDVNSLGFMDRLNIDAKSRGLIDVYFSDEEKVWVEKCKKTQTYEDVVRLTEEIAEWLKYKKKEEDEQNSQKIIPDDSELGDGDDLEQGDGDDSEQGDNSGQESVNQQGNSEQGNSKKGNSELGDGDDLELPEAKTHDCLEKYQKSVSSSKKIYRAFTKEIVDYTFFNYKMVWNDSGQNVTDTMFKKHLKYARELSLPVVREFQRRKAASESKRTRTSLKGSVDTNKIYRYKFDDKIFKEMSYVPTGKSHGMIFLVDNSSSMSDNKDGLFIQTVSLMEFCKKVGIPFRVYLFTSSFNKRKLVSDDEISSPCGIYEIFSSQMTGAEYRKALKSWYDRKSRYLNYGYTPLYSAIGHMFQKIKDFRQEHPVEKMNLIVLTDGLDNGGFFDNQGRRIPRSKETIINVQGNYIKFDPVEINKLIRKMDVNIFNFHYSNVSLLNVEDEVEGYNRKFTINNRVLTSTKKADKKLKNIIANSLCEIIS